MGSGVGSIESATEKLFMDANSEILLTVYSISNRADLLFDWLELALGRGVAARMVINQINEQPVDVKARFHRLAQSFPNLQLLEFVGRDWSDLHAKSIVVDRNRAIVGSSNLSRRGLLTNYELALLVEGPTATIIASVIDRILASDQVIRIEPE
jgi:cardiolipin synthase